MLKDKTPYQRKRALEQALRIRGYTSSELAMRFDLSHRTVTRYIEELKSMFDVRMEMVDSNVIRYRIC